MEIQNANIMLSPIVNDLSQEHFLVSKLFKWPANASEWGQYRLSDEQVKSFHEVGFLSGIKLLKHHPLMVHGSYENKSGMRRRAFVVNVFKEGTRSNTNEVLSKGVPPVKKDSKMEGRFFPLLFDPEKN